jgi:hypothetical protein
VTEAVVALVAPLIAERIPYPTSVEVPVAVRAAELVEEHAERLPSRIFRSNAR